MPLNRIDLCHFSDDLAFVEILVQSGADIELRDSKGKTPLQIAANYFPDSKEIMDYLIAKGADVNARDTNGLCILHVAASEGNHTHSIWPQNELGSFINRLILEWF